MQSRREEFPTPAASVPDLINCILDTQCSLNIKKNVMRLLNPNH